MKCISSVKNESRETWSCRVGRGMEVFHRVVSFAVLMALIIVSDQLEVIRWRQQQN